MFSFVANIPRADLGTRVNPDACRILARTGKFNLPYGFFLCGFQKHLDSKILCAIYSLQALSETTSRTQDQKFLLSFFQLSSDEKLLEE